MNKSNGISSIRYLSNERRDALKVKVTDLELFFIDQSQHNKCIDLSVDGCSLLNCLSAEKDLLQSFTLAYNEKHIGSLMAQCIYVNGNRSGWKFTQTESRVSHFIEALVLDIQKQQLRLEKIQRQAKEERDLLGLKGKAED